MQARSEARYIIGVLDIYGFEIFDHNSFEQLCINYVNEKLQQIFIELTLKAEQEEYVREKIEWTPIDYFNNKVVCDLIEAKRPPGVFAAMNDACATAHADPKAADQSLSQRLTACSHSKHFALYDGNFTVKHYAGDVTYMLSGMTDKNKDQLLRDHLELCKGSSNSFLQTLFPEDLAQDSKRRPPTASDRIKVSANELVTKLMQSQPSYIRTIKPNENKSPSEFDVKRVLHQVKYLGLCENIRIRRAGFAYRQTFEKFVERFYLLSSQTSYAGDFIWTGGSKEACIQILKDTDIKSEEWQIGTTKVFIRHPEVIWGLETMREHYWHGMAQRIQTAWRKYQAFRAAKATKIQRVWRQKRQAFELIKFREHGDGLLGGKKERRRFSICSLRTFNGDYLMVNSRDKHTRGFLLREAAQIGSEPAVFSSRIEFLVPRAMRSARPMPRQLVVTKDHVCIVEEKVVDGLVQHALVSKIDVAAIKDLAMSPYQDGWTVVHLMSQPDLVFNCEFKTEMLTWLNSVSQGRIHLQVNSTISYNNKNMKSTQIKFVKNEAVQRAVFEKKTVQPPHTAYSRRFISSKSNMAETTSEQPAASGNNDFYALSSKTITGKDYPFSQLRDKVVLIVNVASKCGFTPQYKDLEKLHQDYSDKGLVILGFPSNQFGGQEPGSAETIQTFCQKNYDVSFTIMEKSDVNGNEENSVFKYIKAAKPGLLGLKRVKWNFEKFLIDRQGNVVERWASTTSPKDIAPFIEKLL
ncbi:class II myosin [Coemansia sp. RSA 355]|nr:class II myosin [Coemansia sp. RSA 355]